MEQFAGAVELMEFPGYFICKDGRVFSEKSASFLTPIDNGDGYLRVRLWGRPILVSRLVLMAFKDQEPPYGSVAHHINGDRQDNRDVNLEWLSVEEYKEKHSKRKRRSLLSQKPKPGPPPHPNHNVTN